MAGRRPKSRPLDPATRGPVVPGVMDLVSRDRGQIPTELASQLKWLEAKSATETLIVLAEPGLAKLLPWAPDGPRILARRAELISRAAKDEAALDALKTLESRYKRGLIHSDYRMNLPPELTAHLEMPDTPPGRAFCFKVENHIELMSMAYHNRLSNEDHTDLADLP